MNDDDARALEGEGYAVSTLDVDTWAIAGEIGERLRKGSYSMEQAQEQNASGWTYVLPAPHGAYRRYSGVQLSAEQLRQAYDEATRRLADD